jgi:hypothetical protein
VADNSFNCFESGKTISKTIGVLRVAENHSTPNQKRDSLESTLMATTVIQPPKTTKKVVVKKG